MKIQTCHYCQVIRKKIIKYGFIRELEFREGLAKSHVLWVNEKRIEQSYKKILSLLRPKEISGKNTVRIGGNRDGGYVMLEPSPTAVAYSFGVSNHSPWDLEIAKKGIKVFQYDGTIDKKPDEHPNIIFNKFNVSGKDNPPAGWKNISQIFSENSHDDLTDIILQIDIEGGEWEFFENISHNALCKFSQIIVEFHNISNVKNLNYYLPILNKISLTHECIHFHCNNAGGLMLGFRNFIIPSYFEITYVRKDSHIFKNSKKTYPTCLDRANIDTIYDIYIGQFDNILSGH